MTRKSNNPNNRSRLGTLRARRFRVEARKLLDYHYSKLRGAGNWGLRIPLPDGRALRWPNQLDLSLEHAKLIRSKLQEASVTWPIELVQEAQE